MTHFFISYKKEKKQSAGRSQQSSSLYENNLRIYLVQESKINKAWSLLETSDVQIDTELSILLILDLNALVMMLKSKYQYFFFLM